jgi:hypothetical protein
MELGFGLADILVDSEDIGSQGDKAVLTIEPKYLDVESYENGLWDKYLEKWEVKLKVVLEDTSYDKLKIALPALEEWDDMGTIKGLRDGGAHQLVRNKAKKVTIHPRGKGSDTSTDVTIYMAYPVGVLEQTFGKETSKYEVEFVAFPRTANSKDPGNYFLIGDPAGATV